MAAPSILPLLLIGLYVTPILVPIGVAGLVVFGVPIGTLVPLRNRTYSRNVWDMLSALSGAVGSMTVAILAVLLNEPETDVVIMSLLFSCIAGTAIGFGVGYWVRHSHQEVTR